MSDRIRGRRLQTIRGKHFASEPLCVRCLAMTPPRISIATELDHIVALDNGGTDTPDNRQGLCWQCHQDKTAEDMGYTQRQVIGVDGWPESKS